MDETQARQAALMQAVNAHGHKEPGCVIEAAQQYYDFLIGKTKPAAKRKKK